MPGRCRRAYRIGPVISEISIRIGRPFRLNEGHIKIHIDEKDYSFTVTACIPRQADPHLLIPSRMKLITTRMAYCKSRVMQTDETVGHEQYILEAVLCISRECSLRTGLFMV